MWFLGAGLVVLFLKFQEIGPVALALVGSVLPFGLAAVFVDSGQTIQAIPSARRFSEKIPASKRASIASVMPWG